MTEVRSSGGMGFGSALLLLFIGLKLVGAIDWSWWWVFSPLWIPLAGVAVIALILFPFWLNERRNIYRSRRRLRRQRSK